MYFKILNNMLPEALRNRLEIVRSESERQTRQAGNIIIQFRRITTQKICFTKE